VDRIFSYFGDHEVSLTIVILAGILACSLLFRSVRMGSSGWLGGGDTDLPPSTEPHADKEAGPTPPVSPAPSARPSVPPPLSHHTEFEPADEPEADESGSGGFRPLDFDVGDKERRLARHFEPRQAPQAQPFEVPKDVPTAPTETPLVEPAARYINLAFRDAEYVVPWRENLLAFFAYDLRFNIGSLAPDRIPDGRGKAPTPIPGAMLPPSIEGHWLDVVVASRDFTIHKSNRKFQVFLPDEGASWVCDCDPKQPHRCSTRNRRPYLLIPVTTPTEPGDCELRVGVYFKKNLLQSCLVRATVSHDRHEGQSVETDFTLNGTLTELGKLQPKALNILADKIVGGEQGFIINGDFADPVTIRLSEMQLTNAANAARQKLRDIHFTERSSLFGGNQPVNNLDRNNAKSKADFIEDLRQTAPLGYLLWRALFQANPDFQDTLSDDVLREPSTIQIVRASTNFVFPWGLIYDIGLDSDASKHEICKIVDTWHDDKGLPVEGMVKCPHEAEHKKIRFARSAFGDLGTS
jgi:hypothetical protein